MVKRVRWNGSNQGLTRSETGSTMPSDEFPTTPPKIDGRGAQVTERLLDEYGDATVELYGDAALQALKEREDPDVDALLSAVEPLAVVDLSVFERPDETSDLSPEARMEQLEQPSIEPPDESLVEASQTIDRIADENYEVLSREHDAE